MSEKRQITKKELLERARAEALMAWSAAPGNSRGADMEALVFATARALGYEVVEEPELPVRLECDLYAGTVWEDAPLSTIRRCSWLGDRRLLAELVRRYNAKATALAQLSLIEQEVDQFAVHWPRPDLDAMIARIRAAYEEEKP